MESIDTICKEQIKGWYESVDRLRIGGIIRSLQQPGSVVNFMKILYPEEEYPLSRFSELTYRMRYLINKLIKHGIPYLEARRVSDPKTQQWLQKQYDSVKRAGSVVAIVRIKEMVNSFSCRRRKNKKAKGHPITGKKPTDIAFHHLLRARHRIAVYYFFVYDPVWGRASIRISSYFPFEVTLQLNGHELIDRKLKALGRRYEMADNAVADVTDWESLRNLIDEIDIEAEIRRFGDHWVRRLPNGLSDKQIDFAGGYYWYMQTVEASLNYVFKDKDHCSPIYENLLRHNLLIGTPETIRYLFDMKRRPRRTGSSQITVSEVKGCFKAFYGSNWLKCYDKHGYIIRFETVINNAVEFVASKSLSNLRYLVQVGQNASRRLQRTVLTSVCCPISAQGHKSLVETVKDAEGHRVSAIRPEHPAQQALLAALLCLQHSAKGFNNKEFRAVHQRQTGEMLKPSQVTYQFRKFIGHHLIERVGNLRRYRLTQFGRRAAAFVVKLYRHIFSPVIDAAKHGAYVFKDSFSDDPMSVAIFNLFSVMGIVQGHHPLLVKKT
jgi:hypothetical protein